MEERDNTFGQPSAPDGNMPDTAKTAASANEHTMDAVSPVNGAETAVNSPETVKETSMPMQSEQSISQPASPYNSVNTQQGIPSQQTPPPPPQQTPPPQGARRPVYDKFMYEPIGFEGYDRREHIPPEQPQFMNTPDMMMPPPHEKKHTENDTFGLRLISVLIACCVVIGILGISYDVINSKKAMENFKSSAKVVLYSEKKPEGAKDIEECKDENGRYTTEGVAELVRPSIVEIYTYTDPAHKELAGTGSGVVMSKDGYIVTNAHVLESKGYHTIKTIDGDSYSAKIIGRDVKTDIAVVKVDTNKLVPAVLGDSDEVVVGEPVIAIGNPANLSSTVTDGIVSAVNRKIRSDSTGFEMDCIQTNADISPGNSGGALVNMYGQVIGITSSKYVSSSFEGLGFAITINEARPIIEELINNGFIGGRFRIGITLIDMASASKKKLIEDAIKEELPEDFKGVYISKIDKDADIAKSELKEGDFITEIDGKPVSTYDELYDTISSAHGAGDTVKATCAHLKGGKVTYYKIEFKLMEDTSGNY